MFDYATTTCSYTNPQRSDGSVPATPGVDPFQFASSTCVTAYPAPATTSEATTSNVVSILSSAENPVITQDSGSLVFGLGIIIFILSFAVLGLIFGNGTNHRK